MVENIVGASVRYYEPCPICGGAGWIPGTRTGMAPDPSDPTGQTPTPIPVQTQVGCEVCQMTGFVEVGLSQGQVDAAFTRVERLNALNAELLAACEAALKELEYIHKYGPHNSEHSEAELLLQDAIRKAREATDE